MVGRLVFELKANRMPHTARNFMLLANETLGFGYASTKIHRIMPGLFLQGGDAPEVDPATALQLGELVQLLHFPINLHT